MPTKYDPTTLAILSSGDPAAAAIALGAVQSMAVQLPLDGQGHPLPANISVQADAVLAAYQVGADGTDCAPAFTKFQTAWQQTYGFTPVSVAFTPGKTYPFLSQLDVFTVLGLVGLSDMDAFGVAPPPSPRLFFPNGIGIKSWFIGTYPQNPAYGGVLFTRGILVDGPASGGSYVPGPAYDHHGIWTNTGFDIRNTIVQNFGCDGLAVECAIGGTVVEVLTQTAGQPYTLNLGASSPSVVGSATTTATILALQTAINAAFAGAGSLGGTTWQVEVKTAASSTAYTVVIDGITCTYTTPADHGGTAPASTALQTIVVGLAAAANTAVGAGTAAVLDYHVMSVGSAFTGGGSHTVTLSTTNLTINNLVLVASGGLVLIGTTAQQKSAGTTNLKLLPAGASNNSTAYRLHCLANARNGITLRGGDANHCVFTHPDLQANLQCQICDISFLGCLWVGPHCAPNAFDISVPAATSFSGTASFFGLYVEGNVACYFNAQTLSVGGQPASSIQSISSGNYLAQTGTGVLSAPRSVRGAGGGTTGPYSYLGDPSSTTAAFGMGHPSLGGNDLHWNYQVTGIGGQGWFEMGDGYASSGVCLCVSHHNNTRSGPGHVLLQRGHMYGGQNETSAGQILTVGTTPAKRLYSISQDSIDWDVWGEQYGFVNSISAAGVIASTLSTAHTPLPGMRVWLENMGGVLVSGVSANQQWQCIAQTGSGGFTVGTQAGAGITVTGALTASTGICTIMRLRGKTGNGVTGPASLTAGFYAVGDILENAATAGPGTPRYWVCTAAGVGVGATWTPDSAMVLQTRQTASLGNFATGGSLGTAAATVDNFGVLIVAQTTAGQTVTIASPTDTSPRTIKVVNIGSTSVTVQAAAGGGASLAVANGRGADFVWTGTTWQPGS